MPRRPSHWQSSMDYRRADDRYVEDTTLMFQRRQTESLELIDLKLTLILLTLVGIGVILIVVSL